MGGARFASDTVAGNTECAKVITEHWAHVSRKPTTTSAAQDLVLGALERQGAPCLADSDADALGLEVAT